MTVSVWKLFQSYNDQILPVSELLRESTKLLRVQLESCGINANRSASVFRMTQARFPELEYRLFTWMDTIRRLKLELPPSLVIAKAREIAGTLNIPEKDFKASWGWLANFRARKGLGSILLCGEGAEVDKESPELLSRLNELYDVIRQYPARNVYNMDETGLFFRLLPRYTLLMPNEDMKTVRGKKKSKDRVTLVVWANADGSNKIPCMMIGKPKTPA